MSSNSEASNRPRVQVKSLPLAVQNKLKYAFGQTGCMDLYRGDAPTYLQVIGETLRDQAATIRKLQQQARRARKILEES